MDNRTLCAVAARLRGRAGVSGFAVLAILAGGVGSVAAGTTPVDLQFYMADLNGNGSIDSGDYDIIYNNLSHDFESEGRTAYWKDGDVNHDGLVDMNDLGVWTNENMNQLPGNMEPVIPPMDSVDMVSTVMQNGSVVSGITDPNSDYFINVRDEYETISGCGSSSYVDLIKASLPTSAFYGTQFGSTNIVETWHDNSLWYDPGTDYTNTGESVTYAHQEPTMSLVSKSDGFDLEVTWTNTSTTEYKNYGVISIPYIMFGPEVYVRSFRRSSAEQLVSDSFSLNQPSPYNFGIYPNTMYAPCLTVRGFVPECVDDPIDNEDWPDMTTRHTVIGQDISSSATLADGWYVDDIGGYDMLDPETPPSSDLLFDENDTITGHREYVMGVSVEYPVPEYRMATGFRLHRYGTDGGDMDPDTRMFHWVLEIDPNVEENARACDGDGEGALGKLRPCTGELPPDTGGDDHIRTMTIRVRFYRPLKTYTDFNPSTTMGVLDPIHRGHYLNLFREYRRYFKRQYGPVQYDRDPRPVKRQFIGGHGQCSNGDYGFYAGGNDYGNHGVAEVGDNRFDELIEPDGEGWDAYFDAQGHFEVMRDQRGWQRQVMSGPSGAWCDNATVSTPWCRDDAHMIDNPTSGEAYHWPFYVTLLWDYIAQLTWTCDPPCDPNDHEQHPILSTLDAFETWVDGFDMTETTNFGHPDRPTRDLGLWWGRSGSPNIMLSNEARDSHLLELYEGWITVEYDSNGDYVGVTRGTCDSARILVDQSGVNTGTTRSAYNVGHFAALLELESMMDIGVTYIGLDASSVLREWRRYMWVQRLKYEANRISQLATSEDWAGRFTTEAYAADMTHSLCPTFFAITKNGNGFEFPRGPHAMIDFLNQGAESEGHIGPNTTELGNSDVDIAELFGRLVANRGFSPGYPTAWDNNNGGDGPLKMIDGSGDLRTEFLAQDSWLLTVPSDLRDP